MYISFLSLFAFDTSSLTFYKSVSPLRTEERGSTSDMDPDAKSDGGRHESFDGDILKGDIAVGAIAGEEARLATVQEHNLTFPQAIRLYPKAIGWSIYFSLGIIMTAFDPQLLGQLFATPKFQRDFGYKFEGEWIIAAPWQTGLLMGSPIGQVVGAFFAAYVT